MWDFGRNVCVQQLTWKALVSISVGLIFSGYQLFLHTAYETSTSWIFQRQKSAYNRLFWTHLCIGYLLVFGRLVLFHQKNRSGNFMVVYFVLNNLHWGKFQKFTEKACGAMSEVQEMCWTPEHACLDCCVLKYTNLMRVTSALTVPPQWVGSAVLVPGFLPSAFHRSCLLQIAVL